MYIVCMAEGKVTTIRLTDYYKELLEKLAEHLHLSESEVIRQGLTALKKREKL